MSPRQDKTNEPLLYDRRMASAHRVKDATRGQKNDFVTSGIRAKSNRGGPKQSHSCHFPKVLKSVSCAKVAGEVSSDVDENKIMSC